MKSKGQSKNQIRLEVVLNTASGMILAYWMAQLFSIFEPQIQHYIWPGFSFHIGFDTNMITTPIFTLASIIRGLMWRNLFNWIMIVTNDGMSVVNEFLVKIGVR